MNSRSCAFLFSAFAVVAMQFSADGSTIATKAQHSDGLFDFVAALLGRSVEDALPVARVSSSRGQIATAHVRAVRDGFIVSGLVRRQSFINPPPWSHVEVLLLDAKQRVIESVRTRYLPRDIPSGRRGTFPQSHYTALLHTLDPPPGATVRVVFDESG